jgi:hypothetical protein
MTPKNKIVIRGLLVAGFALIFLTGIVYAFNGPAAIDWFSIDGGGGTSTGGDYILSGSVGQPDAGTSLRSESYTLEGGFWSGGTLPPTPNRVYLPLVVR